MTSLAISAERWLALQPGIQALGAKLNYDENSFPQMPFLIRGEYVWPFFCEYSHDYLQAGGVIANVGCEELLKWILEKDAFHKPEYFGVGRDDSKKNTDSSGSNSSSGSGGRNSNSGGSNSSNETERTDKTDKTGWTVLDHATRFVVSVLRHSWDHGGEWGYGCFREDDDTEFHQVWCILRYLQAEWEAASLKAWDSSSLNEALDAEIPTVGRPVAQRRKIKPPMSTS